MEEVFSSAAGLVITVIVGGLVTFLGVWLFARTTRDIDEWAELRKGNLAVAVVMTAMVVAVGIVVRPALQDPFITADVGRTRPLYELMANGIGLLISLLVAIAAVGLSAWLFTRLMTHIDEWSEITEGNQAVALLLAGVLISVALLMATAVDRIVRAVTSALF